MQIQLEREALLKPVSLVAGVVERRQTLPILSYVLVRASGTEISFTGTDLEVEIVATTDGTVDKPGEFTVPARKLFDICRALPEGARVILSKQSEKVIVKAGKSRFSLSTLPPQEFPFIETKKSEQVLTIAQRDLKRVIERTAFCMAQQDVRYYLNGLYLEADGKGIRAVATDGHRMALTEVEFASNSTAAASIIFPRKGVQEISRFLSEESEPLSLELSGNHIRLSIENLTFTSKLIDGKFPDYTKVIPNNLSKIVRLSRSAFREALGRVAILANEKYRGIRLNLEPGKLSVSAHNPEQEEAVEELETDYQGEILEIGFNVNYLLEAIGAIPSDEVVLGLNDSNSSCVLRDTSNSGTQYIVMPMRL